MPSLQLELCLLCQAHSTIPAPDTLVGNADARCSMYSHLAGLRTWVSGKKGKSPSPYFFWLTLRSLTVEREHALEQTGPLLKTLTVSSSNPKESTNRTLGRHLNTLFSDGDGKECVRLWMMDLMIGSHDRLRPAVAHGVVFGLGRQI